MHSAPAPARTAFWETVTRFEKGKLVPLLALRNAAGMALPLAIGTAMGNPGGGLIMTTGALNVSFSDGSDPYLHRARRMLAASFFCALAVLVGGLFGSHHVLAVVLAASCAFIAGMMVPVNTTVADLGTVTLVTLVVFSAQSMTPSRALTAAGLAFAGGLLQMLFSLALWPVHRYAPERRALAALYRALAQSAADPGPATEAPPASAASTDAQTALASLGSDHALESERLLALLSQAERTRLALLALNRIRIRLQREGIEPAAIHAALDCASSLLKTVADSLARGVPLEGPPGCLAGLAKAAESLRVPNASPLQRDARWQIDALAGQLRSAIELSGHATAAGSAGFERRESSRLWRLRLESARDALRANLRLESAAFRHALRLAVCVAIADTAGRSLWPTRSYWAPMTVAIILKPDFTSTFSRGLLRLAGTLAGIAMATALFHFLQPEPGVDVVLIAVLAYLLRYLGPANYGIFVTALTGLVVLMFAVTGVRPAQVMTARGVNTLLGGAIALTAYWLWPTWERTQVFELLAGMIEAYRAYFHAICVDYVDPEHRHPADLDAARLGARLARSNVEASLLKMRAEPGASAAAAAKVDRILATSHRLIHAVMSLEAGLERSRPVPAREAFRVFAADVEKFFDGLASALRGRAPGPLPDLREDYHALVSSGDPHVERYALVNMEADRVTNTLNTLAMEIVEQGTGA